MMLALTFVAKMQVALKENKIREKLKIDIFTVIFLVL